MTYSVCWGATRAVTGASLAEARRHVDVEKATRSAIRYVACCELARCVLNTDC
jgi:hypothetical protein